jgi:hypothetical protein
LNITQEIHSLCFCGKYTYAYIYSYIIKFVVLTACICIVM